jgi:hypothetical protein
MSKLVKIILFAIGLWSLTVLLLFIFPNVLPFLSGFALLLSLPIGFVLFILTVIALIRDIRKVWPVICLLILAVSYFSLRHVTYWGARAHLYLNQNRYKSLALKMVAAGDEIERRSICQEECWIVSHDYGAVAFHYVHGFLNWDDIIYDPSGKIVALKTWDERKQFNTYFISAEHLTGDWYLGYFGD